MPQRFPTLREFLLAHREGALPDGTRVVLDANGAFVDGPFPDEREEIFAGDLVRTLREALVELGVVVEVCPEPAPA